MVTPQAHPAAASHAVPSGSATTIVQMRSVAVGGWRMRVAIRPTRSAWPARPPLLLINGIGASLPMSADGRVMSYAWHGLSGACKAHNMPPWACCAGTRIQAVADYHDLIFFKDPDSLYVKRRPSSIAR